MGSIEHYYFNEDLKSSSCKVLRIQSAGNHSKQTMVSDHAFHKRAEQQQQKKNRSALLKFSSFTLVGGIGDQAGIIRWFGTETG